ncbi:HAD family hydrolase [uncultured Ruthenibacterium sp.]|uniref:HAD family hydrolase n=1 Tax=uncultured Ruthenibacterium sp. TaxID=1905347 RepID=UPI00349EFE44
MYQAVIFDLDGTLLDTIGDLAAAGNFTLQTMGFAGHTVEEYKYMVGNGIPMLLHRMLPEKARTPADEQRAADLFFPYYNEHKEDTTKPYEGMPALLESLRTAGVKLGVVSNKEDHLTRQVIERYFPGVFHEVRGHVLGTPTKPDPHLVNEMRKAFSLMPEQVLYVGDSNVDMFTANNAGLDGCGVLWGFRTAAELQQAGAKYLVHTPVELEKLIFEK